MTYGTSRAKQVLWAVLAPGHRVSPVWRLQYSRVLSLARRARTPGAGQVLVQAALEETDRPPDTGRVGGALELVRQLRWEAVHSWWVWRVPGQCEQLHLVVGDWGRYATGCGSRNVIPLWQHWNGADQPPLGG